MIFRLSQKLSTQIKEGPLSVLPLDQSPFADWSAHLFCVQRTKYVILSNTASLYSTVMYARGIRDHNDFIKAALANLRDFMKDDGLQFIYERLIVPNASSVCFGKAFSRSVTGSMNELIVTASLYLAEGDLPPHEVGLKLNDTLLSSLKGVDGKAYAKPREVFSRLRVDQGATTQ